MPDSSSTLHEIKISELPVATAANATDQLEANQAGTSRSITIDQVSAAVAGSSAVTGSFLPLAGGTLTGTLNANPSTSPSPSANMAWNSLQYAAGTVTGPTSLNQAKIFSDAINAANPSGKDYFVEGFTHNYYFGGATVRGGRTGLASYLYLTTPTAGTNDNFNYTALLGVATANSSDGGTGTAVNTSRGALFGGGSVAVAMTGATNLTNVTGWEFNVAVQTGSSVYAKTLAQFSSRTDDAVKGSGVDTMLWLYKQAAGGPAWTNGILFNHPAVPTAFPFDATSTVMVTGAGTIGIGIDFSASTVATAAFKSPGFSVAGTGAANITSILTVTGPGGVNSGTISHDNTLFTIKGTNAGGNTVFGAAGTDRVMVTSAGNFVPIADNASNLGSGALRWADFRANTATLTGALSSTIGTITVNTPALAATQTWNNVATVFNGAVINVTNTTSAATSRVIDLQSSGVSICSVDILGQIRGSNFIAGSGNQFNVGANKVVGARDTGWVAMTGTTNKATVYDTSSVTLPQLAGRVMALQAALTTHGLIGA